MRMSFSAASCCMSYPPGLCPSATSACSPIATVASSCSSAVPPCTLLLRHPLRPAQLTSAPTVITASCGSLPRFPLPNFPTGCPIHRKRRTLHDPHPCLLYTSDAADDLTRVDLG